MAETKSKSETPMHSALMKKRRAKLIQTIQVLRLTFRGYFGLTFSNRWGYYLDRHMSTKIHSYLDWPDYTPGDWTISSSSTHTSGVNAAIVSHDGFYLYTASSDRTIAITDLTTREKIDQWPAHSDSVRCLCLSKRLLISGSADRTVKVWSVLFDLKLKHTLEGHTGYISSVDINDDHNLIISGCNDRTIGVWCADKGELLRMMKGHSNMVKSVQFVGDLEVVSGATDHTVKVWDPLKEDGSELRSTSEGIKNMIYAVTMNSDRTLLACLFRNGFTVYSWPELELRFYQETHTSFGSFHALDPTLLAVCDGGSSVGWWRVGTDKRMRVFRGHSRNVNGVCFTPCGLRMITVSDDKTARVWDVTHIDTSQDDTSIRAPSTKPKVLSLFG